MSTLMPWPSSVAIEVQDTRPHVEITGVAPLVSSGERMIVGGIADRPCTYEIQLVDGAGGIHRIGVRQDTPESFTATVDTVGLPSGWCFLNVLATDEVANQSQLVDRFLIDEQVAYDVRAITKLAYEAVFRSSLRYDVCVATQPAYDVVSRSSLTYDVVAGVSSAR